VELVGILLYRDLVPPERLLGSWDYGIDHHILLCL